MRRTEPCLPQASFGFVLHTEAGLVPWIWGSDGVQTLLLQRICVLMISLIKALQASVWGLTNSAPWEFRDHPQRCSCFQLSELHTLIFFRPLKSDAAFRGLMSRWYEGREIPPVLGRWHHLHPIIRLLWGVQWFLASVMSGVAEQGLNTALSKWKENGKWCLRVKENYSVSKTSQRKQGWGSQEKWARMGDVEGKERETAQCRAWRWRYG